MPADVGGSCASGSSQLELDTTSAAAAGGSGSGDAPGGGAPTGENKTTVETADGGPPGVVDTAAAAGESIRRTSSVPVKLRKSIATSPHVAGRTLNVPAVKDLDDGGADAEKDNAKGIGVAIKQNATRRGTHTQPFLEQPHACGHLWGRGV